ncbi:MAG: hypothetical protein AABW73_02015 [Nanoarchaeota archaeon]
MEVSTRNDGGRKILGLSFADRLSFSRVKPFSELPGRLILAGRINVEECSSSESLVVKVVIPDSSKPSIAYRDKGVEENFRDACQRYLNDNNYFIVVSSCDLDGQRLSPYIDGDLYIAADE